MNGAVFLIWFQSTIQSTGDRYPGEFSEAEIAARQAGPSRHPIKRLTQRFRETVARLTDRHGMVRQAPSQAL